MGKIPKGKQFNRAIDAKYIGMSGENILVGATTVKVLQIDNAKDVLFCTGTSAPTGAGYAKGCIFIKTDAGSGTEGFYRNIGTTASASFQALDTIVASEIALADGDILVGNAGGVAAANTMGGEVTITNAAVATVGVMASGKIIRATNDTASGASLILSHVSASPATDDVIAAFEGEGKSDAASDVTYATVAVAIDDPTDGAEFGSVRFGAQNGTGAQADCGRILHNGSYGVFAAGDGAAEGVVQSQGDFDLILRTGNAVSGALTITDGAAGALTWAPSGVSAFENVVTDDGALGAQLVGKHISASPATSDVVLQISGIGKDSAANDQTYGVITNEIVTPTDGIESGAIKIKPAVAGTPTDRIIADANGVILVGSLSAGSEPITATDAGVAANPLVAITSITTNGDSDLDNVTLADGIINGQIKKFIVSAVGNAADSVKITPAKMIGGTIITFAANPLGLGCEMIWDAAADGWVVCSNNGGTIS